MSSVLGRLVGHHEMHLGDVVIFLKKRIKKNFLFF
jgi:hypothetical protein